MKDFLRTMPPTNWFRARQLPEGIEQQEVVESGNGLSFTGDIDPTIPEDDVFDVPETVTPAEPVEKLSENRQAENPPQELLTPSPPAEETPRPVEPQSLPEVVINDTARKQLVIADEALEKHWQAFQAAVMARKQLRETFDQALKDSCQPSSDQPTVLGTVYLVKSKACADALVDALEEVELNLKKLLDKERRLLKGINSVQLPAWVRKIQTHRLDIENHLMTGAAALIPSRVSQSEEE